MKHEDSMLWLLEHHIQATLTLIFINMKHEILDGEAAHYYLMQKAKDADAVWEEEVWKKIADTFLIEKESATLYTIK
jgi:hypothetical protein|tara:strand:- start:706 stop:936 length:231 start_codon:yes stop_codon:yes gene_type:complete